MGMLAMLFIALCFFTPCWFIYFLFTLIKYKKCNPADAELFFMKYGKMKQALTVLVVLLAVIVFLLIVAGDDLAEM